MRRHLCLMSLTISMTTTMIFAADGRSESDAFRVVRIVPATSWHPSAATPGVGAAHAAPAFTAEAMKNLEAAIETAWLERAKLNEARVAEQEAEQTVNAEVAVEAPTAEQPAPPRTWTYRVPAEKPFKYHPAQRRTYVTKPPAYYQNRAPRLYKVRPRRTYQDPAIKRFQRRQRYESYLVSVKLVAGLE